MLNPSSDDLNYSEMLNAPKGYELDAAICTTYTLDLEALVGAYIALGLPVGCDSALKDNPAHLFAAMAQVRDKVLVFCEKGKIRCSREYRELYSQVESGIVQVDLEGDNYPSFHPKVWILRFASPKRKAVKYRICVLTRNLTFDGSWDLAATFEGDFTENRKKRSEGGWHLERALAELSDFTDKSALSTKLKDNLGKILKEIGYVYFGSSSGPFSLVYPFFFVSGFPGGGESLNSVDAFLRERIACAKKVLVVSPFLPDNLLSPGPLSLIFNRIGEGGLRAGDVTLALRKDALLGRRGDIACLDGMRVLAVKDELLDVVPEDDAGAATAIASRDIHAKLFAFECEEAGAHVCYLCAGSANATYRAMSVNHEFCFALRSEREGAFDDLLSELGLADGTLDEGIFAILQDKEVTAIAEGEAEPGSDIDRSYDHLLRRLDAKMDIVESERSEGYDVTVRLRPDKENEAFLDQCQMGLLSRKDSVPAAAKALFTGVDLVDLTEFIRLTKGQEGSTPRLIRCAVTSRAARILDKRRAAVFGEIVAASDTSLMDYLQFSLSDNPEQQQALSGSVGFGTGSLSFSVSVDGLYESLLRAFSEKPTQALSVVDDCLQMIRSADQEPSAQLAEAAALMEAFKEGCKDD